MKAFDDSVAVGVNANLCDAVAGLWGGDGSQRNLDFSFTWSPGRPTSPDVPRRVNFSSDRLQMIREAGRILRERAPVPDFELRGAVVKLERAEGAQLGRVTVARYGDGGPRRVSLDLDDLLYRAALSAHDQGKTFRVVGTLEREGRSSVLHDPRDVRIEDE